MAETPETPPKSPAETAVPRAPSGPPPRPGPRPLALHLGVAAMTWASSLAALPHLRRGSLSWRPELRDAAAALEARLARVGADAFARAVATEARRRNLDLIDGIAAYRRHPRRRALADPPAVWHGGSSRLLAYGRPDGTGRPLLVVPSLINRHYILDLTEGGSLMRWLARRGFQPFLVDWGRPGAEERRFSLTDYIAGRLEPMLDQVTRATGRPPQLVGYCMGGLLALALATRRQRDLAGLVLLATPWDFHGEGAVQARLAAGLMAALGPAVDTLGVLPVDAIQAFFACLDPQLVPRKFAAFGRLDPDSRQAADFVALEDWLNDGVPLAGPVARECLAGWYGDNLTARGLWRVAGRPVDPGALRLPSLCLLPRQDRIVPPASALALARAIPGAETMSPAAGHIGMVVSAKAPRQVWQPLARWLAGPDRASATRA